jgi:hypothetical protein
VQSELAPLATVVAALIAAAISFVTLTLSKEQKTSEFRQTWIDGLRSDLASFFAAVRAFARSTEERAHGQANGLPSTPFAFTEETVSMLRHQVAEVRYRIQLRLNPKEADHRELLQLMTAAVEMQQKAMAEQARTEEVLAAVEAAATFAPQVLKVEWERVKQGERPFRIVRNWVAPIVVGLGLAFVAVLAYRAERPNSSIERTATSGLRPPAAAVHVER